MLRVGAARNVITPGLGASIAGYFEERLAQDIHDDLHAKAIVLESGGTSVALVVCDLLGVQLETTDRAKELAQELTGIPAEHILITATHTHFGPDTHRGANVMHGMDYVDWLPGRIADSVRLAQNRLRPARVAYAGGQCPEEVYNRRFRMKDGRVVTNPGRGNPDILAPAGPTDPEVGLLAFVDAELQPIAMLANYALHYVGGAYGALGSVGGNATPVDLSLTADYFGAFDRALSRMMGREVVSVMMNGTCGDINNINVAAPAVQYPHPWYQIERVAEVVAAAAYKAWRTAPVQEFCEAPVLGAAEKRFSFPRRTFTEAEVAAAKQHLAVDHPKNLGDREWLHAHTVVELSQQPRQRPTLIQALRVGETGLVGLPGEIFVEIGLEIKRRSPFAHTLVGELANDALGYIPTAKAFEEGSYEVYTTMATPEVPGLMVETALDLLQQLKT